MEFFGRYYTTVRPMDAWQSERPKRGGFRRNSQGSGFVPRVSIHGTGIRPGSLLPGCRGKGAARELSDPHSPAGGAIAHSKQDSVPDRDDEFSYAHRRLPLARHAHERIFYDAHAVRTARREPGTRRRIPKPYGDPLTKGIFL